MPDELRPTEEETSFPLFLYNCVKFPDCGWLAINHVPESVVSRDIHDVTVEVEYFWINPGRDGWIIIRSNGANGEEQIIGNDINTRKEFFKANEWATWTLRLHDAHFGTREDGTDLYFYFGADPDDECYIRSIKVYATATPENYATFGAMELQSHSRLELNTYNKEKAYVTFDVHTYGPSASGARLPTNWYSGVEVVFGQTDGNVTIDGVAQPYRAEDILFINPDQIRGTDTAITGSCYYMVFDIGNLESHFRNSILTDIRLKKKRFQNVVSREHPAHHTLRCQFQQLIQAYASESPYKELKIQSLLLGLLYHCCENGLVIEAPRSDARLNHIRSAITYMEEHLANPVTVGELAAQVHLSEAYFSRYFKSCIGVPPLEHLTNLRMERAADLLAGGSSVTETAMEVGVSNVGHFIRLFKKRYGATPLQWQKQRHNA